MRFGKPNRGAVGTTNKKVSPAGNLGPWAGAHLGRARPNNSGAGGVLEQTHPLDRSANIRDEAVERGLGMDHLFAGVDA